MQNPIERRRPPIGKLATTVAKSTALILVGVLAIGVLDGLLAKLVRSGGYDTPAVIVVVGGMLWGAAVAWRQDPNGSSLAGIFGGQLASPRSRAGRYEWRRLAAVGSLGATVAVVSLLSWWV